MDYMDSKMAKRVGQKEISKFLKKFSGWRKKKKALVRTEVFSTYTRALQFISRLGKAAEAADHHPDIVMKYKTVTVLFSTHSAGGITALDFKIAATAEKLIQNLL